MKIKAKITVRVAAKHTRVAVRTVHEWTVSKTAIAQAATVCGVVLLRIISVVGSGGV